MATKDFNISPYYDDYSSSKNFHRILFKPQFAVQARELTQAQTILQNQIRKTTTSENGTALRAGEVIYQNDVPYVTLKNDIGSSTSNPDDTVSSIVGTYLVGKTNSVFAKVIAAEAKSTSEITPLTIFVSYLKSASDDLTDVFADAEILYPATSAGAIEEFTSGLLTIGQKYELTDWKSGDDFTNIGASSNADGQTFTATGTTPTTWTNNSVVRRIWNEVGKPAANFTSFTTAFTGSGSIVQVKDGVYFINGYAIDVVGQTVILEKYKSTPTYKVGFSIAESIINVDSDSTLYDNAVASTNYQAPGADRYKIALTLAKKDRTTTTNEKFSELFEIEDGIIQKKDTAKAVTSDDLTTRDYDSKGDGIVDGFDFEVREDLSTKTDIYGISGKNLYGSSASISLGIDKGKALYRGKEVKLSSKTSVSIPKARDTYMDTQDISVNAEIGNYLVTDGAFETTTSDTYDGVFDFADGSGTPFPLLHLVKEVGGVYTAIATARLRDIQREGTSGEFRVYLADIRMESGQVLKDATEIHRWSSSALHTSRKLCGLKSDVNYKMDATGDGVSLDSNVTTLKDTDKNVMLFEFPRKGLNRVSSNSVAMSRRRVTIPISTGTGTTTISASAPADCVFTNTTDDIIVYGKVDASNYRFWTKAEISITSGDTRTVTIDSAGVTADFQDSTTYYVIATVIDSSLEQVTKTLTQITNETFDTFVLARVTKLELQNSDVLLTNFKVYESNHFSDTPTTSDTDITDRYTLDTGQTDNYYDKGYLKLKPNQPLPKGRLLVTYWYFAHSGGDYHAVSSYPVGSSVTNWVSADDSGSIFTINDIPTYTSKSTGKLYRLNDVVDLRSTKLNSESSSLVDGNFGYGSAARIIPDNSSISFTSVTSYLPRIDIVYLDSTGAVKLQSGTSSLTPEVPEVPYDGVSLYNVKLLPYTYDTSEVAVQPAGDKLKNDSDYSNMVRTLENDARSYEIGEGRIKRDVFVDPFVGHNFSDVSNSNFLAAVDFENNEVRPHFTEDNLGFVCNTSSGLAASGNIVTQTISCHVTEIENVECNISIPLRSSDVSTYYGYISVDKFDLWKSTESRESLDYNRNGAWDGIQYVQADRTQGTVWNEWNRNWKGSSNSNFFPINEDTSYTPPNTSNDISSRTLEIGNKSVATNYNPFLRSKTITITAEGLKPYAKLSSITFDGEEIMSSVTATTALISSSKATDVNGKFVGTYVIPNKDEDSTHTHKHQSGNKQITITADGSYAEGNYDASGVNTTGGLATRNFEVSYDNLTENALSQVIEVHSSFFATKLDLYFSATDVYLRNIAVQIRTVENGKPSNNILPYSTVSKTAVGNVEDTAETFTFSSPVFMAKGKYAITIITPSIEYQANALNVDENSGSKGTGVHSLFRGTEEVKDKILRFKLYRANFDSLGGNVVFKTETLPALKLNENPIHTNTSGNVITVYQDGHGYSVGDTVKFEGIKGRVEQDIFLPSGSGLYAAGETVYKTASSTECAHGKVISWGDNCKLRISNISGLFVNGNSVIGSSSTRTIGSDANQISCARRLNGIDIGRVTTVAVVVGNGGSGYSADTNTNTGVTTHTKTGVGSGLTLATTGSGALTSAVVCHGGGGYKVGDIIAVGKGTNGVTEGDGCFSVTAVSGINSDSVCVTGVTSNSYTVQLTGGTDYVPYETGYAENETAVCVECAVRRADLINYGGGVIIPTGACITSWEESRCSGFPTTSDTTKLEIGSNKVKSPTLNISDSVYLRSCFACTSSNRVSPAIDLSTLNATIVANSTDTSGTSSYISRKMITKESANSIYVVFDGKLAKGATVSAYIKSGNSGMGTDFDDESWQVLTQKTSSATGDDGSFGERIYYKDDITDFSVYQIKLALNSGSTTAVPTIKNLKVIPNYKDRSLLPMQSKMISFSCTAITNGAYDTTNRLIVESDFVVDSAEVFFTNVELTEPDVYDAACSYAVNNLATVTSDGHKSYYISRIGSNQGNHPADIEHASDESLVIPNAWQQISIQKPHSEVDGRIQRDTDNTVLNSPNALDGTGAIIQWKRASGDDSYSIRGFAILNGRKPV